MRIISFSIFWSFVTVSLLTINLHAQTDLDYKRSSLHLILIDQNDFFNRNAVKTAFFKSAFPNQYDKVDLKDSFVEDGRKVVNDKQSKITTYRFINEAKKNNEPIRCSWILSKDVVKTYFEDYEA